jgi:WD40 repeat protein
VRAVAFSADSRLLATGDFSGYARVRSTAIGRPVGRQVVAGTEGAALNAVAYGADSRLLTTAGSDGYVRLWHTATGLPANSYLPPPAPASAVRRAAPPR